MKRLFWIAFFLFIFPAISWGADSGACVTAVYPGDKVWHIDCTAHADTGALSVTLTAAQMSEVSGKIAYTVTCYPGDTAPTTDSDLSITDSRGVVLLAAAGNGANIVDDTDTRWDYPEGVSGDGSNNHYHVLHGAFPLVIATTNQAVHAATFSIDIDILDEVP